MPNLNDEVDAANEVRNLIDQIVALSPLKNLGREEVQSIEAERLLVFFDRYQDLSKELQNCSFNDLSVRYLRTIVDTLKPALTEMQAIENLQAPAPTLTINQMSHSLGTNYYQFFSVISDAILKATRPQALEKSLRDIKQMIDVLNSDIQSSEKWFIDTKKDFDEWKSILYINFEKLAKEHEEILDKQRKSLASLESKLGAIGSSVHARKFQKEAFWQFFESYVWLSLSVVLAASLSLYGISIEQAIKDTASLTERGAWAILATRGIIFSVGSVMLFFFIRCFSASRHIAVVNKHRGNALSTFQIFSDAAPDAETRGAVLKEATKAVFSQVSTGYLKAPSESSASTQIVELIKGSHGSGSE